MRIRGLVVLVFVFCSAPSFAGRGCCFTPAGVSGGVLSIAVDPADPGHLVGVRQGEFVESRDGALTWVANPVAFHPYFVRMDSGGTGSLYALSLRDYQQPSNGPILDNDLRISTDSGLTWTARLGGVACDCGIPFVVPDPRIPETIYSAVNASSLHPGPALLKRSIDAGATWRSSAPVGEPPVGEVLALAIAPSDPSAVYLQDSWGTYRSSDAGTTWTRILTVPSPAVELAVDSDDPDVVYASQWSGLVRSDNGGLTWSPPLLADRFPLIEGSSFILTHPTMAGVVFAASGDSVFRSFDYGATWVRLWLPKGAAVRDLAVSRQTLYAATDGGLFAYTFVQILPIPPSPALPRLRR